MSKNTIENNMKVIASSFKSFFKDLDAISLQIAAIKKQEADMKETGNYTEDYIKSVIDEAIASSVVPKNAASIDIMEASSEDLKEATSNLLDASDILEDSRISAALAAVSSLEGVEGIKAASILARQFPGNFAALNLLAATAKDPKVKQTFAKASIDEDGLSGVLSYIDGAIIQLKAMNTAGDMTGLATRVYVLNKALVKDAELFGVPVNLSDYPALSVLLEAKTADTMREALGLPV